MPIVTFSEFKTSKTYPQPVRALEVIQATNPKLIKSALAARVNGHCVDLDYCMTEDASLEVITSESKEGLDILRHSTAHLLAQAVKHLFPMAEVTIGPVIEDGFYYDFAFERPFTPEDLAAIEKEMHTLAKQDIAISRQELPRAEAIQFFKQQSEKYKIEIIEGLPDGVVSLYHQGDFTDLCRGPHVPRTGKLKVFKLTKVAGAYWRGDSKNAMLQRIYGTAWATEEDLKAYLTRLEEAEKRDHRKIGKHLDLFHLQEEAPGMVFWHDKGWTLYQEIVRTIRETLKAHHYQEVHTPIILDKSLWMKSGHWEKFRKEMFTTKSEDHEFAIKPMNCPCHIQIFNQGLKSYRDLPIRLAEFGSCHRNEPSGALHGLMRVRQFTQDDAHIFCTEEQIQSEVSAFIDLVFSVYKMFGFNEVEIRLSTRPVNRVGREELWDKAEQALEIALKYKALSFQVALGEGAFYGPKIDFSLKDSLGRTWQCGTLQVDFSMPEQLGAKYIAEDNSRRPPVMLHRAICGSLERFIGVLLEHYAGKLPLWLSPVQMVVNTITDKQIEYVQKIVDELKKQGVRVIADLRNEKIGFKIREHTLQCIPFLGVVGNQEVQNQTVSVRLQNGENWGAMTVADFIHRFQEQLKI